MTPVDKLPRIPPEMCEWVRKNIDCGDVVEVAFDTACGCTYFNEDDVFTGLALEECVFCGRRIKEIQQTPPHGFLGA